MSHFGERVLINEGTDPLFVPHGVDRGYTALAILSRSARRVPEIGPDTFVIGIAAMNRD